MPHQEIPELDTKGLRQFGLMLGAIFMVLFGFILPWSWGWESSPNYLWVAIGALVLVWALVAPESMRALYHAWMRVAMAIGNVVNGIILAVVYFVVIAPMGIVMRVMGKDPMCRELDKSMASYRVISKVRDRNHVERPY